MRKLSAVIFLMLAGLSLGSASNAEEFVAGRDYQIISQPVPTAGEGKAEVVELFLYTCPHCYHFDPVVEDWLEDKPANAEFVRIPALFNNARQKLQTQAFYTAEVLDIVDKFHKRFFVAMQEQRRRMASKDEIQKFFEQLDVDATTFNDTFDSFAVEAKVRRAADLTGRYGITGVPSIVVNGKYLIDADMAGGHERMIRIVNALIARESKQ